MDIKVYQVPEGAKRAGYWTFSIDGQETLFYSSTRDALSRRVAVLLSGRPKSAVALPGLRLGAGVMGEASLDAGPEAEPWASLPTAEERVAAFLSRGKLGRKEE